jgi:hypothetical protein
LKRKENQEDKLGIKEISSLKTLEEQLLTFHKSINSELNWLNLDIDSYLNKNKININSIYIIYDLKYNTL